MCRSQVASAPLETRKTMDYIRAIERQQIREDIPAVKVGDNVKKIVVR